MKKSELVGIVIIAAILAFVYYPAYHPLFKASEQPPAPQTVVVSRHDYCQEMCGHLCSEKEKGIHETPDHFVAFNCEITPTDNVITGEHNQYTAVLSIPEATIRAACADSTNPVKCWSILSHQ